MHVQPEVCVARSRELTEIVSEATRRVVGRPAEGLDLRVHSQVPPDEKCRRGDVFELLADVFQMATNPRDT
jgi:hypothetical protein